MPNHITVKPNGPLVVRGDLRLIDQTGQLLSSESELYLCRCGKSGTKPYCDGAHKTCGFEDDAEFVDEKSEPLAEDGMLEITLRSNAMLIVKGPVTIENSAGTARTTRNKAALCRCGHSGNKPFCDASHKTCGFTD